MKKIYFFKCQKCGVEFFIYSEREIIEKLCGECAGDDTKNNNSNNLNPVFNCNIAGIE